MLTLIILDLFWSISAFIYDSGKMAQINPLVWPFVIICPIYPLLLAFVWFQLYRKKSPNQLLPPHQTNQGVISRLKKEFSVVGKVNFEDLGTWCGGVLAFAAVPSVIFGILAILYYPTAMVYQGFSWNGLGQIFWVLFYALQGWYLFTKYKIARSAMIVASMYLIIKLILDYKYLTFGYLDFENIPNLAVLVLITIGILSLGVLWILDYTKKKQ